VIPTNATPLLRPPTMRRRPRGLWRLMRQTRTATAGPISPASGVVWQTRPFLHWWIAGVCFRGGGGFWPRIRPPLRPDLAVAQQGGAFVRGLALVGSAEAGGVVCGDGGRSRWAAAAVAGAGWRWWSRRLRQRPTRDSGGRWHGD
jgi:hypothetical protein